VRAALKLSLLILFAAVQAPWVSFTQTLVALLLLSGLFDGIVALAVRASFRSKVLTYWDETAFFLACGAGVTCLP
jgi:hypothetical protein